MFLKAGALSLALLLASRVLGLVRESALAGAFGTPSALAVPTLACWFWELCRELNRCASANTTRIHATSSGG